MRLSFSAADSGKITVNYISISRKYSRRKIFAKKAIAVRRLVPQMLWLLFLSSPHLTARYHLFISVLAHFSPVSFSLSASG